MQYFMTNKGGEQPYAWSPTSGTIEGGFQQIADKIKATPWWALLGIGVLVYFAVKGERRFWHRLFGMRKNPGHSPQYRAAVKRAKRRLLIDQDRERIRPAESAADRVMLRYARAHALGGKRKRKGKR